MSFQKKIRTEPYTVDEAVIALELWCAYQDRYEKEVRQKMVEYQLDPNDAEVILKYLIDDKFIDDARYADAYVRGKIRSNHWGRVKVRLELRAKGITDKWINTAIENFPEEEYLAILSHWIEKKAHKWRLLPVIVQRQKISLFLYQCGWEQEHVLAALDQLYGPSR
jgi:regulatory protein